MKIAVRRSVFETNSSSVHAVSLVPRDDIARWLDGDDAIYCYEPLMRDEQVLTRSRSAEEDERQRQLLEQFGYLYEDCVPMLTGGVFRDELTSEDTIDGRMRCLYQGDGSGMIGFDIDISAYERGDKEIEVRYEARN